MQYKKISEATVQCIISQDDMEEYGLSLSDIFERNEKGENFLREVIERAHDEVGYQIQGEAVAMQITPMKDKSLVLTFSSQTPDNVMKILQQIKDVVGDIAIDALKKSFETAMSDGSPETQIGKNDILEGNLPDNRAAKNEARQAAKDDNRMPLEDKRLVVFDSMYELFRFVKIIPSGSSLKGRLYKWNESYVLLLEKNRISYKNYNKLCAQSIEYGILEPATVSRINYLDEYAEILMDEKTIPVLKRIAGKDSAK